MAWTDAARAASAASRAAKAHHMKKIGSTTQRREIARLHRWERRWVRELGKQNRIATLSKKYNRTYKHWNAAAYRVQQARVKVGLPYMPGVAARIIGRKQ